MRSSHGPRRSRALFLTATASRYPGMTMIAAAASQQGQATPRNAKTGPSPLEKAGVLVFLLAFAAAVFALQVCSLHVKQTRRRNKLARRTLFQRLGLEDEAQNRSSNAGGSSSHGQRETDPIPTKQPRRTVIGFFHPYCNAGGGGERVLWQAIEYHLETDKRAVVVVFSGDVDDGNALNPDGGPYKPHAHDGDISQDKARESLSDGASTASKEEILSKCKDRFDIPLVRPQYASRIHFLPLSKRVLVSDIYWRRLTLLGQSYGAMRLAMEACSQIIPDVWIDTMGYGFAYPIFRLFDHRTPIGAYVHYPMISTDMLRRVKERRAGHTNDAKVSSSPWRSSAKLLYYQGFALAYAFALRRSTVLVANGSWTRDHVNELVMGKMSSKASKLYSSSRFTHIVYPPCDTSSMSAFPLEGRPKMTLLSLAQFRPEKEHSTQIRVIAQVIRRRKAAEQPVTGLHLICAGSSRNSADERRISNLKALARELGIEEHISFVVNAPYSTILNLLRRTSVGLSTMVDEHFGINVVEFMAAGLIPLSHASAGPLLDIAVPVDGKPTGFHASSLDDFADKLERIFLLSANEDRDIRTRARQRAVDVFSNQAFCASWEAHLWRPLVELSTTKKAQ